MLDTNKFYSQANMLESLRMRAAANLTTPLSRSFKGGSQILHTKEL